MLSHPVESQRVKFLPYVMLCLGVNEEFPFSFQTVVDCKVGHRRTNRILQSHPHENRTFDPGSHVHGIKVTQRLQRALPSTRLLTLNPTVHFRPVGGLEVQLPIGQERNVRDAQADTLVQGGG